MSFYINHQYVSLETIKTPEGAYYDGKDEIKRKMAEAWKELDKRFNLEGGGHVVFKTPGIRSGIGKGNMGYSFSRVTQYKTTRGKVTVAWADDKIEENGKINYVPLKSKILQSDKTMILGQDDIEKILFMYLFSPYVARPGKLGGRTFIEDKEQEAIDFAMQETQNAVVAYWLYHEGSPFFNDIDKVSQLARVYGIKPEGKSVVYNKQLITAEIRKAEKRGDAEFNMKAFDSMCKRITQNTDTRDIEAANLVMQAHASGLISFSAERLVWSMNSFEGKPIKTICKVPPQYGDTEKARKFLKQFLIETPSEAEILKTGLETEPDNSNFDKVKVNAAIPVDVDAEWMAQNLDWHSMRRLVIFITKDVKSARGKTKDELLVILTDYFVHNKQTVPYVVG